MKLLPKQVFLIDGIGALVSAFMLGFVLVKLNKYFGMPVDILYLLASLAIIFAIYSFCCYFINPRKWQLFLKLIAIINGLYCSLTLAITIYLLHDLTVLGIAYFLLEILIILLLVRFEWRHALSKKEVTGK